jgi:hypothetical protein
MRIWISGILVAAVAVSGCDSNTNTSSTLEPLDDQPSLAAAKGGHPLLVKANHRLAARKLNYRIAYAEYYTRAESGQVGQILFAFDRGRKHIGASYVPGLERPSGGTTDIRYLVDQSDGATGTAPTLTSAQTEAAIDRAMATWGNVRCSNLDIEKVTDPAIDPDVFDGLSGFGGIGTPLADVTHAGWYPPAFFDLFAPDGGDFIIAITIPFIFTDQDGSPTDLNRDGEADYAFAEIYYNDALAYGIDTALPIDVETVALHETGHGLGQAHFGKIFQTIANGKFHFSPLAVMNAAYSGLNQNLLGTDRGGHCSLWASWPQR